MKQSINPYNFGMEYYSIPTKVEDLIEFLQKVVASVPEELRASIELYYDWEEEYGDTNVTSDLYYIRPPTAEELKAEVAARSKRKDAAKAYELKQLAILQAKYKDEDGGDV
jgi:hypothetical protein